MKLFRRLLLSLFPEELAANAQHPVSMFLSLISPKQFFSVIHRKIAENFKLNLYDITLDPFEIKIGFGEQPTLQVKDIDKYYAYGCVAQLNGNNFFAPGNLAAVATMGIAVDLKDLLKRYDWVYGYHFLMTVYLLSFLFVARFRIFPETDKEAKYKWFIELFFSFFDLVVRQHGAVVDEAKMKKFKNDLLKQLHILFFLFYFYQKLNKLFAAFGLSGREFYAWLLADEQKQPEYQSVIETFLANRETITQQTMFGGGDVELSKLIFPADIQLRYLLQGDEGLSVIELLLKNVYDNEILHDSLMSFLKDDSRLDEFLVRLLDRRQFQEHYFQGMQQISHRLFRLENDYSTNQEIDAFISSLDAENRPEKQQIPERLRQESLLMDRLMNFYMTFIGGLRTGRGDSFALRLFKKPLLEQLVQLCSEEHLRQEALQYYGGLLYTYSKNLFYYSYAHEHIRAGKEVFRLPYKSAYKEVYSNMYLLRMFDESFLCTLFQDITPASLMITVTQRQVVQMFKNLLDERIHQGLGDDDQAVCRYLYTPTSKLLGLGPQLIELLAESLDEREMKSLREQMYTFDAHLRVHSTELIGELEGMIEAYGTMGIVGILATLRETLFGCLLYVTYLLQDEKETEKDLAVSAFKQVYILDVLQISRSWLPAFLEIIDTLQIEYHPLLELWIQLDDNMSYFELAKENWHSFTEKKSAEQVLSDVSGDDVVRCRGFLKSISYYNRRIVRPK